MQKLEVIELKEEYLNIKNITIRGVGIHQNDFPYTLESNDWKRIQMENC
mgnify:CR=1 FL=1